MLRAAIVLPLFLVSAAPVFAQNGAALYAQRCVSCHEGGAVARAPARDVISALAPDRIVAALESGTMRAQGEGLTPDERRAIATYLSTAKLAAVAAAPRLCAPMSTAGMGAAAVRPPAAGDWESWGGVGNNRRQLQPGFDASQIANLQLKWAFAFDGENAAADNPTIVAD